jgi:NADH-quinone oxidoreductase subunit J
MDISVVTLMFYVFSFLVLFSAVMVVSVRNPVHSVLFLIFTFFNAAGLMILLGAEYIAMTLVIVYVGAVAVLFLFVVMMMDVDFATWREGFVKQLPLGLSLALALVMQLLLIFYVSFPQGELLSLPEKAVISNITNAEAIGQVLYTDYAYPFILSGLVLLVAMLGAIILTLRHTEGVKKQQISKQLRRTRAQSIDLLQVESGKGVEL